MTITKGAISAPPHDDLDISSCKGKLLLLNMPYQGHINPTLGTTRALVKAGYSVTYVCDPRWKKQIEESGALFVSYDHYPERPNTVQSLRGGVYAINTGRRLASERQYDALLYESLLLSGKCLADQIGVPSIRLSSTFAYNRSILMKLSNTGGLHVTSLLKFPPIIKAMSLSMRRHKRIESSDFVTEIVDNIPTITYVYTSRAFQLDSASFPEKSFKFIGPSLDGRDLKTSDISLNDELRTAGEKPIIYASLGTIFNNFMPFYKAVVGAFAKQNVTVILSVGKNFDRTELGSVPENIHIHQSVDQLAVLNKAVLFITHGGMNSANEALYYQVPMVVVPMADDQPTVGARIAELGLGKVLSRKAIDKTSLRQTAFDVLEDKQIAANVKKIGEDMQHSGGNRQVVEDLNNLLRDKRKQAG